MENKNSKYKQRNIQTGFIDIDKRTNGLHNSELIILAGRPAMGKSTLALNIAEYVSSNERIPTLVLNIEGVLQPTRNKLIDSDTLFIYDNTLNALKSMERVREMIEKRLDVSVEFTNDNLLNISEITAKCREMKANHNIGLIIIDYLQLIKIGIENIHREHEVSEISRALKLLAIELNIPIILLSQLNREIEKRKDKRPKLTDFRDSKAVVQNADTIIFLYRDSYYNTETENKNVIEVIFAKNKHGALGTDKLLWEETEKKFINLKGELN